MTQNKKVRQGLLPYVFLLLIMLGVFYFVTIANQKINNLTYSEFMKSLDSSEVTELEVKPRERASIYEVRGKLKNYKEKGGKYAFAYEFFGSMSNILDLKYSDYLTALDTVGITNTTDILATGVKIV